MGGRSSIAGAPREESGLLFEPTNMPDETFTKKERITKRSDFIRRSPEDRVLHTPAYRFVFKPSSLSHSRLGIVVTRRDGHAVFRNRVKRVVREVFRRNKARIQPPRDVIVIWKSQSTYPTYRETERSFLAALNRLSENAGRKGNRSTA